MSRKLIALMLSAYLALPLAGPPSVKMCTPQEQRMGSCNVAVTNDDDSVTIGGERSDSGTRGPSDNKRRDSAAPPKACDPAAQPIQTCPRASLRSTQATPAITLTDLAQFAPDPVAATGEPNNLGVAGMPTNFVAAASAHTRAGALFGIPVTVRFTPVGFDFRYGDGDTASTTTGGQTWSALGQASFTPTPTSHIYRERGTYEASVTVRYSAEVDLGTGWFPVQGQLSIDGPVQQIRIFEAHTALVARTCVEQPAAPGC